MISLRRKILFYTFILIFLIATPLVLLYAAGYKINYRSGDLASILSVQKTGMIILETDQDGAQIFINSKPRQAFLKNLFKSEKEIAKTPAKIKGLLPGEYIVELKLSGYWDWQKKIKIESGKIVSITDIKLFKKTLPLHLFKTGISEIQVSPNKKIAFLPTAGNLVDMSRELDSNISSSTNQEALWSHDSNKLLLGHDIFQLKNGSIFDFNKTNLEIFLGNSISNLKWDSHNSNKIYFQDQDSINYFDLNRKQKNILVQDSKLIDYLAGDDYLFYIVARDQKIILKTYSLNNKQVIKELELPWADDYALGLEQNNLLSVYNQEYKTLYLLDPFSIIKPLKNTINNIKYFVWLDDDSIIYANDFEIFTLNLKTGEKKLLTRLSDRINKIITTNSKKYIIYSTDHGINVLEQDILNRLSTTELISLDNFSPPWLAADEKTLYFSAQIGKQTGLYKLEL